MSIFHITEERFKELEAENARLKEELEHELNNRDNLREELAAAQLDAARRYRWLRKGHGHYGLHVIQVNGMFGDKHLTEKKLDAAIDAAMAKEEK